MYYLNCFFIYSIIGFLFETIVAKVTGNRFESGILYGPMTPIYGIGVVLIILISKYFFMNLHLPRWKETIIVFFILIIVLTLMEWLGGILIEKIFGVVFWDYSHMKGSIGKYISVEISLIWGILSLVLIYFIKPFLDKFVLKIPSLITYLFLFLFCADLVMTYVKRKPN
ncbi:MAG: putative ABC transporter permease [Bacilli bacterium]|nr:putative ABC transporter permease [Bacilli bacterium]